MDYFKNHQLWLIRSLLYSIGLWPYADRKSQYIRMCIHIPPAIIATLFMLIKCILVHSNIQLLLQVLIYFAFSIVGLLTYLMCIYNIRKIEELWNSMEQDWKKLEKTHRISIAKRYAQKGNLLSLYVIILLALAALVANVHLFLPPVLDFFMPLNQTRQRITLFPIEIFGGYMNHDFSVTIITIYLISQVVALIAVLVSKFIYFVNHACLLFTLAGNVLEHGFYESGKSNTITDKEKVFYETIVESVEYHNAAIRCSKLIEDLYSFMCLYIMVIGIIALTTITVNAFNFYLSHNFIGTVVCALYLTSVIVAAFIVTHMGQLLIDHSLDVFNKVNAIPWYKTSFKIQKLLLPIMMASLKPSCLTHGKMAVLAHTLFTTLLTSSISFTTVIISI